MKIILIGATGTIGQKVRQRLQKQHEVISVGFDNGDYQVDIASKDSIQNFFQQIGDFDAVISTAGIAEFGSLNELTDEQFNVGWNNKLMGQINILRVGQQYINEGGVILLTSGVLADEPMPGSTSVSAVNGAINSFVKAAALELGDRIRINAISPLFVKETMEMMGMDSSTGLSASDTAILYEAALNGTMSGKVLDARD